MFCSLAQFREGVATICAEPAKFIKRNRNQLRVKFYRYATYEWIYFYIFSHMLECRQINIKIYIYI